VAKEIIVVQAGWVVMGEAVADTHGNVHVSKADCIRTWGTTAGLGEIAVNGPTKGTVLDYLGEVDIPVRSILMRIKCKG
jgi:hypothetical protein